MTEWEQTLALNDCLKERDTLQRQVKIAVETLTVFIEDGYLREEAVKALAEIQKEQV